MRKTQLINNEIYHIYNRGIDKRSIFSDDNDRLRFVLNFLKYNDSEIDSGNNKNTAIDQIFQTKPYVHILAFCLMNNHFHFLVEQIQEGGISNWIQKWCHGYSLYFNIKHGRSGSLFESRFKAEHVNSDEYLLQIMRYIHLNPLDYFDNKWRNDGIDSIEESKKFLNEYQWSSYQNIKIDQKYPIQIDLALDKLSMTQEELETSMFDWAKKQNSLPVPGTGSRYRR
ncbi:MAG: transposase [Patescibacteria group bacterium]